MSPALIVRFRPAGPWRFGPENGARDQVDRVFHSDSLYSAVTIAMRDLGWLTHWLAVTAESASPAVRLSSCFPYIRRSLLVQPPRSIWPPAQTGKLRWKAARFVPVSVIPALLRGEDLNEEQWAVEPLSGCLLPMDRSATPAPPFRMMTRYGAPVDRMSGASEESFATACLQFAGSAGMWFAAVFEDESARETWAPRIRSATRLLADSGIGGERSRGWGRSGPPSFEDVSFPAFLTGEEEPSGERAWWMLSLFSPSDTDQVDWSRGNYEVTTRAGRVNSRGHLKPAARMVAEGSVVLSAAAPCGVARDIAAGAEHPIYRSGIALAVPIGWQESRRLSWLAAERHIAAPAPEEALLSVPPVAEVPPESEPAGSAPLLEQPLIAEVAEESVYESPDWLVSMAEQPSLEPAEAPAAPAAAAPADEFGGAADALEPASAAPQDDAGSAQLADEFAGAEVAETDLPEPASAAPQDDAASAQLADEFTAAEVALTDLPQPGSAASQDESPAAEADEADEPSSAASPDSEAPKAEAPDEPPVGDPPAIETPVEPPADEPSVDEPPVEEPPSQEPPVSEPDERQS